MADSNITKRALASSLKELLEEIPFEKISVAHICEKCGMNRKSFYYHFKDKYDLMNWIFDTDFIDLMLKRPDDLWDSLKMMFNYFYENRNFYCRALQVKGQNSFSEHFREFLHPLLRTRIEELLGYKEIPQLYIDFFADGIVCAIERWLLSKECMPPEQFASTIQRLVQSSVIELYHNMTKNENDSEMPPK